MKFNLQTFPLWTALITPFTQEGQVDYPSLTKLLKRQEKAGNGLLILGSTGEALNLGENERKSIIEFVCAQKLTVPIMAGVGGINLPETLDWVAYLEKLAIHAYLMVTPLYAKPGAEGQYHWFKTLMDAVTRPVMLYNIPGRAGVALHHLAVQRLQDHPNFWAIKEASGSAEEFARYQHDAPQGVVMSGDDPLLPNYVPHGCQGLVSVASNLWPEETKLYMELALKGGLKNAPLWKECCQALFLASNPIPAKVLSHQLGLISTPNLRAPLTHLELNAGQIQTLQAAHEKILAWYQRKEN